MKEKFVILLEYPHIWNDNSGDLSVWKEWDENLNKYTYHIGVEGFIGYKNLNEGIAYYEQMSNAFNEYLKANTISSPKQNDNIVYHSRDIEVENDKDNKCVWIYVSEPSLGFNCLYDTYLWLKDIIKQLKTISIE